VFTREETAPFSKERSEKRMDQSISLPTQALVLLCGPADSGKSTFAARYFTLTQIVSSDTCRAMICDSTKNFRVNRQTFDLFHYIIQARLALGHFTIAESTAFHAFAHAPLLERAHQAKFQTSLIMFDVPFTICVERDEQRDKPVPYDVHVEQHTLLQQAKQLVQNEDWSHIHTVEAETTDVRFVRQSKQKSSSTERSEQMQQQAVTPQHPVFDIGSHS
jgi:protein phosphatase